jgi:hypothetical protein
MAEFSCTIHCIHKEMVLHEAKCSGPVVWFCENFLGILGMENLIYYFHSKYVIIVISISTLKKENQAFS